MDAVEAQLRELRRRNYQAAFGKPWSEEGAAEAERQLVAYVDSNDQQELDNVRSSGSGLVAGPVPSAAAPHSVRRYSKRQGLAPRRPSH